MAETEQCFNRRARVCAHDQAKLGDATGFELAQRDLEQRCGEKQGSLLGHEQGAAPNILSPLTPTTVSPLMRPPKRLDIPAAKTTAVRGIRDRFF